MIMCDLAPLDHKANGSVGPLAFLQSFECKPHLQAVFTAVHPRLLPAQQIMAATHCLLDTVSEADTAQNFCNEVKTIANDCDGALQAPHTAGASTLFCSTRTSITQTCTKCR